MRTLAARLVFDADERADLEQEVWHAALRRPAADGVPLRAWLTGIARHLAALLHRGGVRRRRRERAVARSDDAPSTADVVARSELQQRLLAAVNGLPSGMRDVVLLRNDGNLVFTNVTTLWAPGFGSLGVTGLAVGDFDGNGGPDLWVGATTGSRQFRFVVGAFVLAGSLPASTNGASFVVADVDDDADLDVVIASTGGLVQLAVNDGAGNVTLAPSRLSLPMAGAPSVCGADFDRDGDVDVVAADSSATARLLVNRHRDLVVGQPAIGQAWSVQMASAPGYATLHHVARVAIALAALGPSAR